MVVPRDARYTFTVPYAGETAAYYERLSGAGAAPEIVLVTANEIIAVRHQTLRDWLALHPSQPAKDEMAKQIRDLLRRVHDELGLCRRDVHIDNLVVTDDAVPLMIGPKWCAPAVNSFCYDLDGPERSQLSPPELHLTQGIVGVWWGSPERYRSLLDAFGEWAE